MAMVNVFHRWLRRGEEIQWHAAANRGADNTRQVGGTLYLTDQRLVFEPHLVERMTQESPWEAAIDDIIVTTGPGTWDTNVPGLHELALKHRIEVIQPDGSQEDFWLAHLGEPLERLAK